MAGEQSEDTASPQLENPHANVCFFFVEATDHPGNPVSVERTKLLRLTAANADRSFDQWIYPEGAITFAAIKRSALTMSSKGQLMQGGKVLKTRSEEAALRLFLTFIKRSNNSGRVFLVGDCSCRRQAEVLTQALQRHELKPRIDVTFCSVKSLAALTPKSRDLAQCKLYPKDWLNRLCRLLDVPVIKGYSTVSTVKTLRSLAYALLRSSELPESLTTMVRRSGETWDLCISAA